MKPTVLKAGKDCLLVCTYVFKLLCIWVSTFRGGEFRTAYACLGELRGIVSSSVCFMALTATATRATFEIIIEHLSLNNPVVMGYYPIDQIYFYL